MLLQTRQTSVLIIGAGPAGYTAAIYAARANLNPMMVMGDQPGGQLMVTTDVENYPGFAQTIQGPWLMEQMQAQAQHVGTQMIQDHVVRVDFSRSGAFLAYGDSGTVYEGKSLIIATGAQAKWLGIPSEETYRGYGVSACATCDGFFFRGKNVCVVGGGNTAVEEALYLTHHAASVTLIHRRDHLRAEKILQDRLFAHPKVTVQWNAEIVAFEGEKNPHLKLTHVMVRDTQTGAVGAHITDGVFIAIGHKPQTEVFKDHVALDSEGYIVVRPGTTQTSVPGVFAAGDVCDKVYRQAVTAAGLGCMAALDANRYIEGH